MKRTNLHAILAVVVGLCVSAGVFAQASRNDMPAADKYVISARAGAVNYLEGAVSIIRATGRSGILLKRDVVEVGDRVTTGSDGRAEILLNPGSYIRLGKNSSFEFGATDLEDLQIRLDSGSAMFEVFATDEFRVSVFTPKGKVALIDNGIYRVDVSTDGTALLSVTKGKAEVGETNATVVKDGRTGTVGTDTVAINKFDKDKRDDLAEWSRDRSKALTKINESLSGRNLSNALLAGFRRGAWACTTQWDFGSTTRRSAATVSCLLVMAGVRLMVAGTTTAFTHTGLVFTIRSVTAVEATFHKERFRPVCRELIFRVADRARFQPVRSEATALMTRQTRFRPARARELPMNLLLS
ncbi:MAG: FecR family protein [Pyrinomonadaceae bacterium]